MITANKARELVKAANHLENVYWAIENSATIGDKTLSYILPSPCDTTYIINHLTTIGGFRVTIVNSNCIKVSW